MKNLIVVIFGMLLINSVPAQKVTGYWYGQANVQLAGIQNNYLTELIISQKGTKVKGFFGYYFKDVYQSFLVRGTYDPSTRKIVIKNIPIIFYETNSTQNSVDCITNFYGSLFVSKVKTTLTGYFVRDKKYTYTCPDLRVSYTLYEEAKVEDSIFSEMTNSRMLWKEPEESTAKTSPEKSKDSGPATLSVDSLIKTPIAVAEKISRPAVVGAANINPDLDKINDQFKKRKQVLSKEIEVSSDSVRLSFYDNAEVDGDSISVFLNSSLVLAHQLLSERAFTVYVRLDSAKEVNEVSMFAENLGKYPPNTALMVVSDGDKRYEIFLSSDFKGNATVRFKRKRGNGIAGLKQ
jgi:hypothetical protein